MGTPSRPTRRLLYCSYDQRFRKYYLLPSSSSATSTSFTSMCHGRGTGNVRCFGESMIRFVLYFTFQSFKHGSCSVLLQRCYEGAAKMRAFLLTVLLHVVVSTQIAMARHGSLPRDRRCSGERIDHCLPIYRIQDFLQHRPAKMAAHCLYVSLS